MEFNYDDIEPLKLNEAQPQLCQILYDEEYKTTMGTLLALMAKNELSERALAMTELGISTLASHYSIWCYRFDIIKALKKDLYEELDWLESIAIDNEKNYQIWNYRQLIIGQIPDFDATREFPILNTMIMEDSKNHHVWTYRHWLVEKFNLFENEKELKFIDELLENDVYNNSAWSHRFFIKFNYEKVDVDEELNYVEHKIRLSPQNESSWNYLMGIYEKFQIPLTKLQPFLNEFVNPDIIDNTNNDDLELIKSSFALELLAKTYNNEKSLIIYDLLISKYDPIRENYWKYLKSKISSN